ncbi:MAG: alanyl-tRNA editing protein, partial [Candidatus Aminicenantes bacterium]|nr:alanyl-tRNA editing protein [Candidatus Aminicenantes bacterium]
MTEILCHSDSYERSFIARITSVDDVAHGVILDRTAFYPGGGGQLCDTGKLIANGFEFPVFKVKKTPDGVLHEIAAESGLPAAGIEITGEIDWDRRYKLMRTHTAMHILCGVVFRDFGAQVTG